MCKLFSLDKYVWDHRIEMNISSVLDDKKYVMNELKYFIFYVHTLTYSAS